LYTLDQWELLLAAAKVKQRRNGIFLPRWELETQAWRKQSEKMASLTLENVGGNRQQWVQPPSPITNEMHKMQKTHQSEEGRPQPQRLREKPVVEYGRDERWDPMA
jgi:hypothetical protein